MINEHNELASCEEGQTLALDDSALNCDLHQMESANISFDDDKLPWCEEGERLIMDSSAINCECSERERRAPVIGERGYDGDDEEEMNVQTHSNHRHLLRLEYVTEALHALTMLLPCRHASFCQSCANETEFCPICNEVVYGTVKVYCGIFIL